MMKKLFNYLMLFAAALVVGVSCSDEIEETEVDVTTTPSEYVVTFDSQGGSDVASQTIEAGGVAKEPEAPTHPDELLFDAWYDAAADGEEFDFTTAINADKTLYAYWLAQYDVTIEYGNGDTETNKVVNYGSTISEPETPTYDGYILVGWYVDGDTSTDPYDFSVGVTSDLTIKAVWKLLVTYKVTIDNGVDAEPTVLTVNEDDAVPEPETPTRTDYYTFKGWYVDGLESNGEYDFSVGVTSELTIKAVWEEPSANVNVTFVQNFFSTDISSNVEILRFATISESEAVSPAGCVGTWYTDEDCTTPYDFSETVNEDLKLYGGDWQMQDGDGNTYPIVEIGGTYWMAQNIRTTKYSDGTSMTVTNDKTTLSTATNLIDVPFAAHIMDVDTEVETDAVVVERTEKWGMLYNWYAIGGTYGSICPTGWHVPSYDEYVALYSATSDYGSKYSKHLASNEEDSWVATESAPTINVGSPLEDLTTNNASGFNLYGSPAIFDGGNFKATDIDEATGNLDYKAEANLWTSTEKDASSTGVIQVQGARFRGNLNYISWYGRPKQYLLSVRCMKDAE